ncbi:MAG: DUF6249 domain-containing protein [Salaquimonas sp.]|nr:DUF6249 domain-containing protein [Salaquimonas sp.]
MNTIGIGAGLAAAAFWAFVAVVAVAGIWGNIRKREAQHETLRHMIDSGQQIDPALAQKILSQRTERIDRDLMAGGLITLFAAPGLAILGWFLSFVAAEAFWPLIGVALLVGCVGIGLIAASGVIRRSYEREDAE